MIHYSIIEYVNKGTIFYQETDHLYELGVIFIVSGKFHYLNEHNLND
jgi:hypothetical protein